MNDCKYGGTTTASVSMSLKGLDEFNEAMEQVEIARMNLQAAVFRADRAAQMLGLEIGQPTDNAD